MDYRSRSAFVSEEVRFSASRGRCGSALTFIEAGAAATIGAGLAARCTA
jgi:hypothetical protein